MALITLDSPQGICVAFDDATFADTPTWTRLDDATQAWRVTAIEWERGRDGELNQTVPGTATVTIVDRDGTFDATNPSSIFANKLDPNKRAAIALFDPVAEEWHQVFDGYVSEWLGDFWPNASRQTVTLELVGIFDQLSDLEMTPGNIGDTVPAGAEGDVYFNETDGVLEVSQRMHNALDDAGVPSSRRRLFTGNVDAQAAVYERLDALMTALFDAADAEFPDVSNLFEGKTGLIEFRGRLARYNPHDFEATDDLSRSGDNVVCFWSCGSRDIAAADAEVAAIQNLGWRRSKKDIINAALVLPKGVTAEQVPDALVTDPTSIGQYGWRSISFEELLTLRGNEPGTPTAIDECILFATHYVANYKDPRTRITNLTFKSRRPANVLAGAIWKVLCGLEVSDVIHVETNHWGGAGGFDEDYFVEKLSYTARPLEGDLWTVECTADVSPATFYTTNPFPAA